jgi:hypothetical protein
MSVVGDTEKNWLNKFENFIIRWEEEARALTEQMLDPDECLQISDDFKKELDGLLIRKPLIISDEDISKRWERLDGKLNSILAMICTSSELKTTKKF